ncbi:MAG: SprT family zinc-dependent metalloprotease [Coriobacteriia bacterium]
MTNPPLDYTVRLSDRARNVRLSVSARDGLVIVVPRRFDVRRVPAIVESRHDWAERALARADERRAHLADDAPPTRIELPGIGETWQVEYRPSAGSGVRVHAAEGRIALSGAVHDAEECRVALVRWVRRRARDVLELRLRQIAGEIGMPVSRVAIGWQRTRWGSCSATGTISLNAKLLFLPPALLHSVLVHELCHTQRLDHSAAFYAIVERHDPGHRTMRAALRQAWRYVPGWAGE